MAYQPSLLSQTANYMIIHSAAFLRDHDMQMAIYFLTVLSMIDNMTQHLQDIAI
mgnify:CR=1 FL=1